MLLKNANIDHHKIAFYAQSHYVTHFNSHTHTYKSFYIYAMVDNPSLSHSSLK